jgi:hypothetical protein
MKSILKSLIDYSLFEKYDKNYFINNKIVPIFENDISIKIAVCKSSNLQRINVGKCIKSMYILKGFFCSNSSSLRAL